MEAVEYQDVHRHIVERCRTGDRKAQYEIYKLYSKAMFNVSMRICGDYAEAEDVLQEAFLSAFQNINSYKFEASFGSWLKRIVVNQAIGMLRKKKFETNSIEERDFADEIEVSDDEEMNYQVDSVKRAIQKLPEGYKVVLSLYLFEGYDHGEISEVLSISETTSKTQYLRAKKKLLEILKK